MNIKQMGAERELIKQALSVGGQADIQNTHDISAAIHNISASFEELKLAIGGPQSDRIVAVINSLASAVNGVAELTRLVTASGLDKVLLPIANILTGGAFSGLTAIISSLGWLASQGEALDKVAGSIRGVIGSIESFFGSLGNLVPSWMRGDSGAPGQQPKTTPEDGANGLLTPGDGVRAAQPLPNVGPAPTPEDGANGLMHRMNFVPPQKDKRPIITTVSLNIDGQQLARSNAYELAELYENSSASPAANGMAYADINGGFTAS